MENALIVTSIAGADNEVLRLLARESAGRGWRFIVIGDRKSPPGFQLDGCDYFDIDRQKRLDLELAQICPEGHYSRKNLGYLLAMAAGANVLVETDDDNQPLAGFWDDRTVTVDASRTTGPGWVNVYRSFTDELVWPRGYPLDLIQDGPPEPIGEALESIHCPIQMGLADTDPDVDAIYRLVMPLPVRFSERAPIAVSDGAVCPFNSQNTTWFPEAWPLMYLPATCSFRMTDIWRSLIATRLAQSYGWGVLFTSATVFQERNEHDLIRDFEQEIPGYRGNRRIWGLLQGLEIGSDPSRSADDLRACYRAMIAAGFFDADEETLLEAWLADIARVT